MMERCAATRQRGNADRKRDAKTTVSTRFRLAPSSSATILVLLLALPAAAHATGYTMLPEPRRQR